jgi:peptide subunit release factor 1 (eRF1)
MIDLDTLKQIIVQGRGRVLSLYLDIDRARQENQSSQPAWRIFLKDAISDVEAQHHSEKHWKQIRARVDAFFADFEPQAKGFAAFFTTDSERTFELPVPVEARSYYGKPLIAPLLWAVDEYEPYLVVMVDQEKAELLTAYLGNTTVEKKLESDLEAYDFEQKTLMPATSAMAAGGGEGITAGSNREAFQNMINEHIAGFHREVVAEVVRLAEKRPNIRIILGGEERSAHAVQRLLPERLTSSVVGVLPIPMYLSERQVLPQVLPAASEYEREQEMKLVQEVIDFAKSHGRGALGRADVDLALTMQRVELLVLPYPLDDEVAATELSARAFESSGSVELVHGEAAEILRQEGGVAARLYYAITPVEAQTPPVA